MSLDFQNLTLSNDPLPHEDLCGLRNERREVQEKLEAIQKRVSPLISAPGAPTRKQLLAQLSAYNTILAPHKLLPTELLSQIFLSIYPEPSFIPAQIPSCPLAVSQVCSLWRSVALDTPELWANVILRLSNHTSVRAADAVHVAEQWLGRSRTCGASLVVFNQLPHDDPSKYETIFQRVFQHLIDPLSHRLQVLELKAIPYATLRPFLKGPTAFPKLHSLSLILGPQTVVSNEDLDIGHGKLVMFSKKTSPGLKHLEISGFKPRVLTKNFDFPWASMTRLHLPCMQLSHRRSLDILKLCRRLEDCQLLVAGDDPSSVLGQTHSDLHPPIMLSSLRKLTVEVDRKQSVGSWFASIATPALESLSIACDTHGQFEVPSNDNSWFQSFMKFLGQYDRPPLEVLHIDFALNTPYSTSSNEKTDQLQIVALSQVVPGLTELRLPIAPSLHDGTLPRPLLHMLGQGKVLPKLKILVGQVAVLEDLVQMLESRWEMARSHLHSSPESTPGGGKVSNCLEYVMVEHLGNITVDQATRIDRLRRNGIVIHASKSDV